ncbi:MULTISPECIES: 16S rRNA (cytidine(1402)-2'-O)-methyltransferase [unclassified Devosia]|uniref:16S rRNA (cytidine(1402)-2'-O)-methyltransferase n=1 Tax=unclassified Devosia TaxID=196773 RepID=UPI0015517A61|nr:MULTISPECIES: 16S rRNA (cytidine(1402)-2'-O)-methyltransferase [unclassified Devosia]
MSSEFFIAGTKLEAPPLAPGLYVVATPIGNLRDITIRALETLAAAAAVLCEDTRMSARLLDHYGIKTRRVALHEHNERAKADDIVARIAAGEALALISDAGTPLLSDPGFPLIRALAAADLPVFAVPGASALLSALVVAGLPTDAFAFHGFLPAKAGARATALAAVSVSRETLVFYESPRRLDDTLAAMAQTLGPDRQAAVALELTKRFERVQRGTLAELAESFAEGDTKGEAVIVVAGAAEAPAPDAADWQAALLAEMADQPLRAAVDAVTARFGLKRKEVYDAALALKATD